MARRKTDRISLAGLFRCARARSLAVVRSVSDNVCYHLLSHVDTLSSVHTAVSVGGKHGIT